MERITYFFYSFFFVFLLLNSCKIHKDQESHYCSSASFFQEVISYAPISEPTIADIEDLSAAIDVKPSYENYPLVVELPIFQGSSFLSDEAIQQEIGRLQALYPQGRKFVLKIMGKLATDMEQLNAKALLIEKLLPATPILLEVSYERLVLLCKLNDSVFLRPWIYPALKYYLRRGDEQLCIEELTKLIQSVEDFSNIQLVITLSVSRPFPRLHELLAFLRSQYVLVRLIVLSLERPPKQILASAQRKARQVAMSSPSSSSPSPIMYTTNTPGNSPEQSTSTTTPRLTSTSEPQTVGSTSTPTSTSASTVTHTPIPTVPPTTSTSTSTSTSASTGSGSAPTSPSMGKGMDAGEGQQVEVPPSGTGSGGGGGVKVLDSPEGDTASSEKWKRVVVAAGAKGKVELVKKVEKEEIGRKLIWKFKTEGKDIAFGVVFAENEKDTNMTELLTLRRYSSHLQTIEGELEIKKAGVYRLRWDNSYSKLRKKVLHLTSRVVSAETRERKERQTGEGGGEERDAGSMVENLISLDTLDPYELLQTIEVATNKTITVQDFVPVSAGRVLEPFIGAVGYGKFAIRPSPFCGFAVFLMNFEDVQSTPINRFINFKRFYIQMTPLLKELESQNLVTNLLNAQKVKKIIKRCTLESMELPDIVAYLTDTSKAGVTNKFIHSTQFLIVHNMMDIAALDIRRRCMCTQATSYASAPNNSGLAASCTGCI